MRVRLHAEARAELREARRWYYERARSPRPHSPTPSTQYPLAEHKTHKLVLQRFPFNIFYLPGEREIVIVAVAHQRPAARLLGQLDLQVLACRQKQLAGKIPNRWLHESTRE